MRKEVWFAIIGILIIIIGAWLIFKTKSCDADYCFEEAARDCNKAKITITDEDGGITFYKIMGKEGDNCRLYIQVKTLTGLSEENAILFKDADMTCDIPRTDFGRMKMAEMMDNLDYCHGRLKEAILEVTLKQVYGLVTRDMGNVLKEINKVI